MRSLVLALLLAGGLIYGAIHLFNLQFAAGEVYLRILHPANRSQGFPPALRQPAARCPGVTVERNYRALEFLPEGVTVFLLAIPQPEFGAGPGALPAEYGRFGSPRQSHGGHADPGFRRR